MKWRPHILFVYLGLSFLVVPYVICRDSKTKRLVDHGRQATYEEAKEICKINGQSLPTIDDLQEIGELAENFNAIWILPHVVRRECPMDYINCDKDRCVSPALVCDGVDNCHDRSDEMGCNNRNHHIQNGFELFENNWLKTFDQELGVIEAVQLCADNKAEFWIPRTTKEYEYIQNVISTLLIDYMWFPVNDTETEGKLRYANGDDVSPADKIPWGNLNNPDDEDCAQIDADGIVLMYGCDDKDAGIVCRSKF